MVRQTISSSPNTETKRAEVADHEVPPQKKVLTIPKTEHKVAAIPFNREQLTKIFKKHDIDNNGKLSWDEVKAAFIELKASWPWFSTEQGFRHGDDNGDQYINIHDQELEHLVDFVLKRGFTIK